MSIEALWYSSYDEQRNPPRCKRLCRLPMEAQWLAAIDMAISFVSGDAGYRRVYISRTRESYWYWAHPLSSTGWWLVPRRVELRVFALRSAATTQAIRRWRRGVSTQEILCVLERWKRTGTWRKHASRITPRHPLV